MLFTFRMNLLNGFVEDQKDKDNAGVKIVVDVILICMMAANWLLV